MPTSRDPQERWDFWTAKDNGTLYMTADQLRDRVATLEAENKRLTALVDEALASNDGLRAEFLQAVIEKAQAEAQLAQPVPNAGGQWEPLSEGEHKFPDEKILVNGDYMAIWIGGEPEWEWCHLSPNIRLCRLTGEGTQVDE
jgi:hypothetical protein